MRQEKFICLSPVQLRSFRFCIKPKIDGICLGSDCCENLLPLPYDIKRVCEAGIKPLVALPILTDYYLDKLLNLAEIIINFWKIPEFSCNDIGTLISLREKFDDQIRVSAGRHLTTLLSRNSFNYFEKFAKKFQIYSFELDVPSSADGYLKSGKFKIAFHYPFQHYSITRICPYLKEITKSCHYECASKIVPLDGGKLFWQSKAFYTYSAKLPDLTPFRLLLSMKTETASGVL